MAKDAKYLNNVVTPVGVAVFPHVHSPDVSTYGQGKYNIMLRLDRDAHGLDVLKQTMVTFANENICVPKGVPMSSVKLCLQSGDRMADSNPKHAHLRGFMVLKAKSTRAPTLLDNHKDARGMWAPLTGENNKVYGGAYVRLVVSLATYSIDERVVEIVDGVRRERVIVSHGVNALLETVQFVRNGEKLVGTGGGGGANLGDLPAGAVDEDIVIHNDGNGASSAASLFD